MASAGSTSLKGSHRRMAKFLDDSRMLGVGNNNDGKFGKDAKDPGKKKDDSDDGDDSEDDSETISSATAVPTLRPNSQPNPAPVVSPSSAIPPTTPSKPTPSPASSPHGSVPTTPILNPTVSPVSASSTSVPTIGAVNPTASPVSTPSAISTSTQDPTTTENSTPSNQEKVSSSPTIISTSVMTITRSLFPFEVTLEGGADQFVEVNEALKMTLEFFLESRLGEFFEPIQSVELEEFAIESVQRQIIRRTFGFGGHVDFSDDSDVPSTEQVHIAQRLVLLEYMFEWSELLKDNGIFLDVVDVTFEGDGADQGDDKKDVDDDDGGGGDAESAHDDEPPVNRVVGDGGNGRNSDDDNSTIIWVALLAAGFVIAIGFFVAQRRRASEIEDEGLALDEPEDDFMVDTGDAKPLTWNNVFQLSTGEMEEFEEIRPKPETEFMNIPALAKNEVIRLQSVTRVSDNRDALVVDTFHNNDRIYSRPASSDEDPANCVVA